MAKLNIVIRHNLSQEEATERIKKLLANTKRQYADKISNLQENWRGNIGTFSFKAVGFSVSGTLTITSANVQIDGNLPFAANFFKGRIKEVIRAEADKLLK